MPPLLPELLEPPEEEPPLVLVLPEEVEPLLVLVVPVPVVDVAPVLPVPVLVAFGLVVVLVPLLFS